MCALLLHRDYGRREIRPRDGTVTAELTLRATGRADDLLTTQRNKIEVADRAASLVSDVLGLAERPPKLSRDVRADAGRTRHGRIVHDDRLREAGAADNHVIHDSGLHRERQTVHEWQREDPPPWKERTADRDESRDARAHDA